MTKLRGVIRAGSLWEAARKIEGKVGPNFNVKAKVSLKEGKNRKLRSLHISYITHCECCGPELVVYHKGLRIA